MHIVSLCLVLLWSYYQFLVSHIICLFPLIFQGCFTGTGAIVRLPQCRWSNPEGYGYITVIGSYLITAKHNELLTMCIILGTCGMYCIYILIFRVCISSNSPCKTQVHCWLANIMSYGLMYVWNFNVTSINYSGAETEIFQGWCAVWLELSSNTAPYPSWSTWWIS